jgi:hypothetical protein
MWELFEITCPWTWVGYDGETLERAHRKKVGMDDPLRAELEQGYPYQKVEPVTMNE